MIALIVLIISLLAVVAAGALGLTSPPLIVGIVVAVIIAVGLWLIATVPKTPPNN